MITRVTTDHRLPVGICENSRQAISQWHWLGQQAWNKTWQLADVVIDGIVIVPVRDCGRQDCLLAPRQEERDHLLHGRHIIARVHRQP
jgi:hypothetical protein